MHVAFFRTVRVHVFSKEVDVEASYLRVKAASEMHVLNIPLTHKIGRAKVHSSSPDIVLPFGLSVKPDQGKLKPELAHASSESEMFSDHDSIPPSSPSTSEHVSEVSSDGAIDPPIAPVAIEPASDSTPGAASSSGPPAAPPVPIPKKRGIVSYEEVLTNKNSCVCACHARIAFVRA